MASSAVTTPLPMATALCHPISLQCAPTGNSPKTGPTIPNMTASSQVVSPMKTPARRSCVQRRTRSVTKTATNPQTRLITSTTGSVSR